MLVGILVPLGATVIAMSRVTEVWQLWVTAILTSTLGQSALSVVSMALVGKWFGRRISVAMGVYSVLVVVGYITAFMVLGPAIVQHGWRGPWLVFGCIILFGIAPLSWLVVRPTPEAVGLYGEFQTETAAATGTNWREALRTQAFWLFGLATAYFGLLIGGIMLFYESILRERGFGADVRNTVLGVETLAGLIASFAGGWAGLRWPPGKLMALAMGILAAALVMLANLSSLAGVMVYAATDGGRRGTGDSAFLLGVGAGLRTEGFGQDPRHRAGTLHCGGRLWAADSGTGPRNLRVLRPGVLCARGDLRGVRPVGVVRAGAPPDMRLPAVLRTVCPCGAARTSRLRVSGLRIR